MTKSESTKMATLEQMFCITATDNSLGAWCREQARAALEAAAKAQDAELNSLEDALGTAYIAGMKEGARKARKIK